VNAAIASTAAINCDYEPSAVSIRQALFFLFLPLCLCKSTVRGEKNPDDELSCFPYFFLACPAVLYSIYFLIASDVLTL